MSDYGRGGWPQARPGPGGPGHGPVPPPGQGGPGYGQAPYGPPQGGPGYGGPGYGPAGGHPRPGPPPHPSGGHRQDHPGHPPTGVLPGPVGQPPPWPAPGTGQAPPPPGYSAPPRRRGPILVAVVAVLALVAGGIGGLLWLNGRGGADSPSAAVQLLAADLAEQNLVGAVSRLHPAEATLATDLSTVITDELVRLEVLRPDAELGLGTVEIKDLRLDDAAAEQVRADVVINKVVSGTVTMSQGSADLPFTDEFAQRAFPDGMVPAGQPTTIDLADVAAQAGEPIRLASVRVDGEWYVSLFYTAADYGLREAGLSWPATSVPAVGAATPQDAVQETVQAILDQDARRLVELAPPGELQVVHDVGEVLIAEAGRGAPSGASLVELETTETDVRGYTGLQLSRAVIDADGQRVTVERDGDCLTATAPGGAPERFCSADVLDQFGDTGDPTLQRLAPRLIQAAFDVEVVTVEVDGAHYVSPGQTAINLYGDILGVLEPQDVRDLLDAMG